MQKKGGFWKIFFIVMIILILITSIAACIFLFKKIDNSQFYNDQINSGELTNPVTNITDEKAIEKFDESFVYYLLYSLKAYNLHNPPLSSDKPKIEIRVDSDPFNAIIESGKIIVKKGSIENKDVLIKTTKSEAVKMLREGSKVFESFSSESSTIEMVAGKATLFGKGYLQMYEEITGKKLI